MRSRSHKIAKVASVAEAEERRFGQLAGRSRRHLQEQLARLGELNAFQQNYISKSADTSTISATHWQDYQGFLRRLNAAVNAQQQIVRDCESSLATHRQRWMAKRQRLQSLERVIEKYRAEERQHYARQEQKRLDELPSSPGLGFEADFD